MYHKYVHSNYLLPTYLLWQVQSLKQMDVSKNRGILPPKWMVFIKMENPIKVWFIMENPMNKWMIWGGVFLLFLVQHPNLGKHSIILLLSYRWSGATGSSNSEVSGRVVEKRRAWSVKVVGGFYGDFGSRNGLKIV